MMQRSEIEPAMKSSIYGVRKQEYSRRRTVTYRAANIGPGGKPLEFKILAPRDNAKNSKSP